MSCPAKISVPVGPAQRCSPWCGTRLHLQSGLVSKLQRMAGGNHQSRMVLGEWDWWPARPESCFVRLDAPQSRLGLGFVPPVYAFKLDFKLAWAMSFIAQAYRDRMSLSPSWP